MYQLWTRGTENLPISHKCGAIFDTDHKYKIAQICESYSQLSNI